MTQQRQAHAVISREIARIGRPLISPVHPGYAAIVATAHADKAPPERDAPVRTTGRIGVRTLHRVSLSCEGWPQPQR